MSDEQTTLPGGDYVPAVVTRGDYLFLAGQTARKGEEMVATGVVGDRVDNETARQCARQCVDNLLAHVRDQLGGFDGIRRVAHINVYVAASSDFSGHSKVADAASQRLVEVLGERGQHARTAVGVSSLPRQSPVEVDARIEVAQG